MSEDLIKKSDAIKALEREKSDWNNDYNVPIDNCIKRLNKVKSVDRLQGKWIIHSNGKMCDCSACNESYDRTFEYVDEWNFCPNCGARMLIKDYKNAVEHMEHDAIWEPTYNADDGSM